MRESGERHFGDLIQSLLLACLGLAALCPRPIFAEEALRTFSSADKSRTLKARLESVDTEYGTMTLRKEDGNRITVEMTKFSPEDMAYAKAFAKKASGALELDPSLHPTLAPSTARYRADLKKLDGSKERTLAETAAKYLKVLESESERATNDGKLDLLKALEMEKKSTQAGTLPVADPLYRFASSILSARRGYHKEKSKVMETYAKDRKNLDDGYLATLGRLHSKASDPTLVDQINLEKKGLIEGQATIAKGASNAGSWPIPMEGTKWKHIGDRYEVWTFSNDMINGKYTYELKGKDQLIVDMGDRKIHFRLDRDGKTLNEGGKPNRVRIE